MVFEDIKIYRITHIENLPHILKYGITHKTALNANVDYISIGDESLIQTRENRKIRVDNGVFPIKNPRLILLGEFTPFYFGVKMPMLYVIQNGGNFILKETKPQEIIYLALSLKEVVNSGVEYYFSDGHATDNLSSVYDSSNIEFLPKIIDWNAVKSVYWGGNENLNLKRKKQAEFLVKGAIHPSLIYGFGCYNEFALNILNNYGIQSSQIKIIPKAYF